MKYNGPVVYMVRADDGPVKIGTTTAAGIHNRLKSMQVDNHHVLTPIRIIKFASIRAEEWLHNHFEAQFIRGEWFDFNPDMLTVKIPRHLLETVILKNATEYVSARARRTIQKRIEAQEHLYLLKRETGITEE